MSTSKRIHPPNLFVWVADRMTADGLPDFPNASGLASAPSCIAIGCNSDMDEGTEFVIGQALQVAPGGTPSFDGMLETPNKKITVWTTDLKKLFEEKVLTERTRVRIWLNRA